MSNNLSDEEIATALEDFRKKKLSRQLQQKTSAKKSPKKQQKYQPKTIFQHMGLGGSGKGKMQGVMQDIKKIAISGIIFAVAGLIIGLMLDIFLETGYWYMVIALLFTLLWLLKIGGKYLR